MAVNKSRLGRGLGSLIANASPVKPAAPTKDNPSQAAAAPAAPQANGFLEILVSAIEPSPYQARRDISPESLKELADSISSEGLLQPIVVRKQGDKYQLIAGERRWRAFQMLKLKSIPARIAQANNASSAVIGMIENLQREGLNPLDEAFGYASLVRDFDLTQEQVAERVGKSRASVANSLRLLSLDEEMRAYVSKGLLTLGHAKVLLGVEDGAQRVVLARRVIEEGLNVRDTERLVQQRREAATAAVTPASGPGKGRAVPPAEAAAITSITKKLTTHFGARVALQHSPKRGKIIIEYAGNEDLQRILEKLGLEA